MSTYAYVGAAAAAPMLARLRFAALRRPRPRSVGPTTMMLFSTTFRPSTGGNKHIPDVATRARIRAGRPPAAAVVLLMPRLIALILTHAAVPCCLFCFFCVFFWPCPAPLARCPPGCFRSLSRGCNCRLPRRSLRPSSNVAGARATLRVDGAGGEATARCCWVGRAVVVAPACARRAALASAA